MTGTQEVQQESKTLTILQWIALATSLILVVLIITSIVRVGIVFWWFSDLASWAGRNLGLEDAGATAFAVIATAAVTLIAPYFAAFILLGRRRLEVSIASVAIAVLVVILLTFAGSDVYFDQRTGQPLKYYVDTPRGIVFSREAGFDKVTGVQRKPVTPEIIISIQNERAGIRPKRLSLRSLKDVELFGTVDGKPKVWLYTKSDMEFELFDSPGFHPQFREPLKPITPELVNTIESYLAKQSAKVDDERNREDLVKAEGHIRSGRLEEARTLVSAVLTRSPHDKKAQGLLLAIDNTAAKVAAEQARQRALQEARERERTTAAAQEARDRQVQEAADRERARAAAQEARDRQLREVADRERERAAVQEGRERRTLSWSERQRAEDAAREAEFRAKIPDYSAPPWNQLPGNRVMRVDRIFQDCIARLGNAIGSNNFCGNQATIGAGPAD